MEIKLRGKFWKQITQAAYIDLENHHKAVFIDEFYGEKTYFMEVYDAPVLEGEA